LTEVTSQIEDRSSLCSSVILNVESVTPRVIFHRYQLTENRMLARIFTRKVKPYLTLIRYQDLSRFLNNNIIEMNTVATRLLASKAFLLKELVHKEEGGGKKCQLSK